MRLVNGRGVGSHGWGAHRVDCMTNSHQKQPSRRMQQRQPAAIRSSSHHPANQAHRNVSAMLRTVRGSHPASTIRVRLAPSASGRPAGGSASITFCTRPSSRELNCCQMRPTCNWRLGTAGHGGGRDARHRLGEAWHGMGGEKAV